MSFFAGIRRATRSGFDRMVKARERQARRYVNAALLQFDDETLARAGFSRQELERQGAIFPM
ncbi:MAG: hypothetical protein BroJett030_09400 [Alphaproteobacteria bacterium]|nr:MAG: hypothetical protein BroJett030_09400 [Alphaproteobacteria bacterium]